MDSRGFTRHDRLEIEGELVLVFAGVMEEDDRILVKGWDLHDLIASQFATDWENRVRCGVFRVVIERVNGDGTATPEGDRPLHAAD